LKEELERNPDFEIPEQFFKLMVQIEDKLRPTIEARLQELRSKDNAAVMVTG
jgi:hypothetical protein